MNGGFEESEEGIAKTILFAPRKRKTRKSFFRIPKPQIDLNLEGDSTIEKYLEVI